MMWSFLREMLCSTNVCFGLFQESALDIRRSFVDLNVGKQVYFQGNKF